MSLSSEYRSYIHSEAWKARRLRIIRRDGYQCRVCGARSGLQVHHVRYGRPLGSESDADLTTLCFWCHLVVTWWLRVRRLWRWMWA